MSIAGSQLWALQRQTINTNPQLYFWSERKGLIIAYRLTFALYLLSTSLNITSVIKPKWFRSHVVVGSLVADSSYGLGKYCSRSAISGQDSKQCRPFPADHDCDVSGEGFCAVWRSSEFAMWVSLVFQGAALVGYLNTVFMPRNNFSFESGWKVISGCIGTSAVMGMVATLSMAALLENSDRFFTGHWRLGLAWIFALVSWILSILIIVVLVAVGLMSPREYLDFYDTDLEEDDGDDETTREHDDFYYYQRQVRRTYGSF